MRVVHFVHLSTLPDYTICPPPPPRVAFPQPQFLSSFPRRRTKTTRSSLLFFLSLHRCRHIRSSPGFPSCLDQHGPSAPPLSTLCPVDSPSGLFSSPRFPRPSPSFPASSSVSILRVDALGLGLGLRSSALDGLTGGPSLAQRCGVGKRMPVPVLAPLLEI